MGRFERFVGTPAKATNIWDFDLDVQLGVAFPRDGVIHLRITP
jgi:hypothetical protein